MKFKDQKHFRSIRGLSWYSLRRLRLRPAAFVRQNDEALNALDVSKSPFRIYLRKFNNHSELYFSGCVGFVWLFRLPCHK